MTRRLLAVLVVGLALLGSAMAGAKPRSKAHQSHRRDKKKPVPASGSASGSGSGADVGSGSAMQTPAAPTGSGQGADGSAGADASSGVLRGGISPPGLTDEVVAPPGLTPVEPPHRAPTLAMRPRTPVHGGFVDKMDCNACHTADGWELSGKAGASGFDHDRTGFPLRGAHVQSDCSGCHTSMAKPATTCEGCHEDPHQGRNNGSCAECHTATAWRDTNALEQHRRTRMPLTGRHATTDCVACHRRQSERQWSDVPTNCYACHRAEYHGDTHPTHDGTDGHRLFPRDCGQCHQTSAWSPALRDSTVATFATMRTIEHGAYFDLTTGSHRTAECASCHADPRRQQVVRCDGCHVDATLRQQHGGKQTSHVATACLRCHPRGAAR